MELFVKQHGELIIGIIAIAFYGLLVLGKVMETRRKKRSNSHD